MESDSLRASWLWAINMAVLIIIYVTVVEQTSAAQLLLAVDDDYHVTIEQLRGRILFTLPLTIIVLYAAHRIVKRLWRKNSKEAMEKAKGNDVPAGKTSPTYRIDVSNVASGVEIIGTTIEEDGEDGAYEGVYVPLDAIEELIATLRAKQQELGR